MQVNELYGEAFVHKKNRRPHERPPFGYRFWKALII